MLMKFGSSLVPWASSFPWGCCSFNVAG